jgi:2-oxoglutarate dehydrogenase complex dehydrogenase (E1) component-like enzyme
MHLKISPQVEQKPHAPKLVQPDELLHYLVQSDTFARFVLDKTPQAYSFPMWGLNNELTAIKTLIRAAAARGVEAVHMGMHHRGRDEFMHNVMGVPLVRARVHACACVCVCVCVRVCVCVLSMCCVQASNPSSL